MASLVVGASGALGRAAAEVLRSRGGRVLAVSRSQDGFDVTEERSIAAYFKGLKEEGVAIRNVFVATGSLTSGKGREPEKRLEEVDGAEAAELYKINAVGPLLVLKHAKALMPRDDRVTFAAISARVGSIEDNRLGGWYSYRASKAALNQLLRSASVEMARTHKKSVVAALHPGTVPSALTSAGKARKFTGTPEESATCLLDVIDDLTESDTGGFFAYDGSRIPF